ncbi:hypothetical protein [Ancylobacter terrae]|uniref:hypothetical protein n=1 Tax=Ancylobacter sp. sgz301288 TaxID=3342077 RepID=UPI00385C936C
MMSLSTFGAAAGIALAATFALPAQATPMAPMGSLAVKQSVADSPAQPIQVRRGGWGGGPHWGGGPRWRNPGWHGGPRYGWRGGPGWRRGWGPGYGYWGPRYGYWGPRYNNWAWGVPLGLGVGAAIAAAPYYNNNNCGWVNTRTWVNGRRVWARQWQCW